MKNINFEKIIKELAENPNIESISITKWEVLGVYGVFPIMTVDRVNPEKAECVPLQVCPIYVKEKEKSIKKR